MLLDALDGELKPYLKYSAALHVGLAALFVFALTRNHISATQTYRIDFIGPSAGIVNREIEEEAKKAAGRRAAATPGKIAPLQDRDAFDRAQRHLPLPRPSILSSPREEKLPEPSVTPAENPGTKEQPAPAPGANASQGTAPADAAVSADLPNFPYPWYISQVRGSLWTQWSAVMPSGGGEAMVEFVILRNGTVTDLRVESSSGERLFDSAAIGAVQSAAPFPPLPRGFPDLFLRIHVRFTSQ